MSKERCVLALDQGTTSSRAILFDRAGRVVGVAQREHAQHFPRPAWVEHDAEEIWRAQRAVAERVVADAGLESGDIAAAGITNQRETTVLWDKATGKPIHRAIVWQDRRTATAIDELVAAGHGELIRERTGLVADAYFSASKIAWLLDNVPDARERAAAGELAFGTIDCWIAYNLSGGRQHVTDPSNASRTMLYDIVAGRWDAELLALFDVPAALLPRVRSSSEVYGEIGMGSPLDGIALAGIAGDQQAALMGQLCLQPGMTKCTYGTGCFLLQNTGAHRVDSEHGLLSTVAWRLADDTAFALEGSVFVGGAVVQWLRDGLGIIESAADVEALAATVRDTGGAYFVPAFAGLGAPHWDAGARGSISGLTRGTNRAHLARAALESIAFQVADVVDAMVADTGNALPELRVDGGAAANDLLLQLQADILQAPVVRPVVVETTALGAALLAGTAVGHWEKAEDLLSHRPAPQRFVPTVEPAEAARRRGRWVEAVERARRWEPSP